MPGINVYLSEDENRLLNIVRFVFNVKSKSEAVRTLLLYQKENLEKMMNDYMKDGIIQEKFHPVKIIKPISLPIQGLDVNQL
jgi:hypothetical protein